MLAMAFSALKTDEMTRGEIEHMNLVRRLASECIVVLENDGTLPIKECGRLALYGNGARQTIKGGTGSGDVNSRFVIPISEGLISAGFEITTNDWLDRYDAQNEINLADYKARVRKYAEESSTSLANAYFEIVFGTPDMPRITEEDITASGTDTAIYVIARASGEGKDRTASKGDYYLTDDEEYNISLIRRRYAKVVVIINGGGVIDTAFLKSQNVNSILVVSQLGNVGGHVVADVITGISDPCGRLTDTWAKAYDDYPGKDDFSSNNGNTDDEFYKEGMYVGYRYFDSFGVEPAYPFGYGKSYTDFDIAVAETALDGEVFSAKLVVYNTGSEYAGKQVVQAYVSSPEGSLDKPFQDLAAFAKTDTLNPGQTQTIKLSFRMSDLAVFEKSSGRKVLEPGEYIVRIGKDCVDTIVAAVIKVKDLIVTQNLSRLFEDEGQYDFEELTNPGTGAQNHAEKDAAEKLKVPSYELNSHSVVTDSVRYCGIRETLRDERRDEKLTLGSVIGRRCGLSQFVAQLTVEEMAHICVGRYDPDGQNSEIVFSASPNVPGAASETTSDFYRSRSIQPVVMADGPAGLRLQPHFKATTQDELLPGGEVFGLVANPFPEDTPADAVDYYQYCTAIPIATALAQSWNTVLIREIGTMVGEEMETFGVNLWLAPGMNIHRNPLCGRNYEYYSEDPLLTGRCAAADTLGVQSVEGRGTTIKHFCCNNQEDNRMFSNSHVKERTLRDLYLRGFEIAVRESSPMAVMASYNLLNGIHTCNSYELLQNVLRDEWGYEGAVMTDWYSSFEEVGFLGYNKVFKYPPASSRRCIYAGCDWQMPGSAANEEDIITAIRDDRLLLADLQKCVMDILRLCLKCM